MGILLFNAAGYRWLTSLFESNANTRLEAQLDENQYNESDLISVKVPATHLPYYTNSKTFERTDGQLEVNGVQYKYVKRRFYRDSIELMCIPNQSAMKLQTAREDFFKLVNDLQHNGQGKKSDSHPGSSKNFSIDNFTLGTQLVFHVPAESPETKYYPVSDSPVSQFSETAELPPDIC